ncbi:MULTISPECIES: glycine--tRNA ligase [Gracilimonas]|uniref:Glycine--tRNA ligase n=1 Tax=Gracilimonas sediminicola TaxID=2952158 RepID=A0A9X2L271_9BACT|nr:glycine--tRNA ligase [Gracilimonas sediminicola]MCP9290955.1 glycine--tRNA ligase [Gracilimonas sediminicola]
MSNLDNLDKIVSLAKARGFIFQSSEIYGGLSAVYDYGPLGVELKRNIRNAWWKEMTRRHDNIVGVDAAIFMHPKVWEASGHVGGFNDPMIDDKQSKKRYRADMLIEQHIEKLRKDDKHEEANAIQEKLDTCGSRKSLTEDLHEIIMENEIRAPESGAFDWTEVRQFNLMFKTQFGSTSTEEDGVYLRPETAQGIFVNYKNVMDTSRTTIPFGIAQTGKAFRNEVVARQFVFRMREFEQMEMQYFVKPGTDEEEYEKWLEKRLEWHKKMGIREENLRTAPHPEDKLAHYARAAADIQYKYPIGWQEVEGIHNRTDFDLTQHAEHSGKKLDYYDQKNQERFVPYVIETSVGLDRLTLMVLCDAYREEEVDGDSRTVLKLNPTIAPTQVGIFPLIKKDKLQDLAHKIEEDLREEFSVLYDESGSIGKRYRRQDEAGTPFCVTVDFDGVESEGEDTVTIRYRDDMSQDRVPVSRLAEVIRDGMKDWKPE